MRCAKSYKFWHMWTVPFHLWNGTDRCVKKNILFYSFLSLLYYFSLFSLLLFFYFLPPLAPCSCHSLFPFSSSFFSSIFTVASGYFFFLFSFFRSLSLRLFLYFFFLSLSLSLSFPVTKKKAIPIWSRARRLKLANLNLYLPIKSFAHPGVVANLCSSSSTALATDGWLSLVIDWSVGLGFCWRFWVFILFYFILLRFLDLEFVGGSSDCGCSLWRWLLLWRWL